MRGQKAQSVHPDVCMCEEARGPRCMQVCWRAGVGGERVVGEAWRPSG